MTSTYESFSDHHEPRLVEPSISLGKLTQLMLSAGLPVDEYGKGEAKEINDLQNEVAEGECFLTIASDGTLTRHVKPVWINVLCHLKDGRVMVLREQKQVLKDGRIRERNLPSSLGEKLKLGEDTDATALRALEEEIGVTDVTYIEKVKEESRTFTPPTFPGIESTYSSTFYDAVIPESAFVPEGYVEHQDKKDNYYVWDQQLSAEE